mgnify:CR=1 FL=1
MPFCRDYVQESILTEENLTKVGFLYFDHLIVIHVVQCVNEYFDIHRQMISRHCDPDPGS